MHKQSREQGKRDGLKLLARIDAPNGHQHTLESIRRIQERHPQGTPEYEYWGGFFTAVNQGK